MCKCCMGNNQEESCGWPKGTVRASIAVVVIIFGILSLSTLMILLYTDEKYEGALGVSSTIGGLVGIVIGYYFGSKSAEGATNAIIHSEERLFKQSENMSRMVDNINSVGVNNNNNRRNVRKKRRNNKDENRDDIDVELGEILLE